MASHKFIIFFIIIVGIVAVNSDPQKYTQINLESLRNNGLDRQISLKTFGGRVKRSDPNSDDERHQGIFTNDFDASSVQLEESQGISRERTVWQEIPGRAEDYEEMWSLAEELLESLEEEDAMRERERLKAVMQDNSEVRAQNPDRAEEIRNKEKERRRRYEERLKTRKAQNPEWAEEIRNKKREKSRCYRERLKTQKAQNPELAEEIHKEEKEWKRRSKERLETRKAQNPEWAEEIRNKKREKNRCYRERLKTKEAQNPEWAEEIRNKKREKNRCYRERLKAKKAQNPEYAE